MIEFGIHWLTLTFRGDLAAHNEYLIGALEVPYEDSSRGGMWYQASRRWLNGATLFYTPELEYMSLSVTGTACETLGLAKLLGITRYCLECGGSCSRIDLAFDGLEITPKQFYESACADELRSKVHRDQIHIHDNYRHIDTTATLGKRSSERFLRVYDRRGDTRIELESKGRMAAGAAKCIVDSKNVLDTARGLMLGYVDMVKLDAWQYFRDVDAVAVEWRRVNSAICLAKSINWLLRQVAGTLAALNQFDWWLLQQVIAKGVAVKSFGRTLVSYCDSDLPDDINTPEKVLAYRGAWGLLGGDV